MPPNKITLNQSVTIKKYQHITSCKYFNYFLINGSNMLNTQTNETALNNQTAANISLAPITPKSFCEKYPNTVRMGGLRKYLFERETNGLEEYGAVLNIGGKILIDENKFFDWVRSGRAAKKSKVVKSGRKTKAA